MILYCLGIEHLLPQQISNHFVSLGLRQELQTPS